MTNVAKCVALGLSVIVGSIAGTTPASAETRWRNLDTSNGTLYLGVAGGPDCHGTTCWLHDGQRIILWTRSQQDQLWSEHQIGATPIRNHFLAAPATPSCLGVQDGSMANGASLISWSCNSAPDQNWIMLPPPNEAPPSFRGCFTFLNAKSLLTVSVAGGTVRLGQVVVQDLFKWGTTGQETGWRKDQFWCPEQ